MHNKEITINKLQKRAFENKRNKGFNLTDINKEFCLLYGEVGEAYEAWRKKKKDTANRPYPSCRGAWRSRTALAGFADQRLNRSSNAPFWKGISPAVFICGCKVSNKSANIETISLKPVLF